MSNIVFHKQPFRNGCGPTCLRIILEYYGSYITESEITRYSLLQKDGWNTIQFATAAYHCGLKTEVLSLNIMDLADVDYPIVVQGTMHYIVLYKVKKNRIYVADPAIGKVVYTFDEFEEKYSSDKSIAVLKFTKLPDFKKNGNVKSNLVLIKTFGAYLVPFKSVLSKAIIIALIVALSQTILPFLTRSIIDVGLQNTAWDFIELLLLGNILLVLANILGTFVHTYLITHITNRIKYSMLDDYMRKLLSTKYAFFIGAKIGDLLQRVSDNERILSFLGGICISSFFALLNIIVFSAILFYFDYKLFLIYLLLSLLYVSWNILFLNQRKKLDYNFWDIKSTNNKLMLQVFNNIIDIKSFAAFQRYVTLWKNNIFDLFKQNMAFFYYSQTQEVGSNIIMQCKNIVLTYVSCKMVLDGNITIGTLFAVQYIIGSLNTPLYQIVEFFNQYQLVMISLNRIYAFNTLPDDNNKEAISFLPKNRNLVIKDISFRYPDSSVALQRVNLAFQIGKKYGIIGHSGCGKSTLLKIICGILEPAVGEIWLGTTNVHALSIDNYRSIFSIDLQESNLFEGSILANIVVDLANYDEDRLIKCVEIAAIRREIERLPQSYNTLIEGDNRKLSRGQAQRILIARAIYKQADIYVFDEIANCLNIEMEKTIISKIDDFLADKTRIYVSHRIESLQNCDLLYYMSNGTIADIGTYNDLTNRQRI